MPENTEWQKQFKAIDKVMRQHERGLLGFKEARRTAVLVTMQPNSHGELEILFEHRSKTMRRQPGEVSFPGGHVEPEDANEAEAALREASEELGVQKSDIELMGALDVFAPSSNLVVFPFVGLLNEGVELHPNMDEVETVFRLGYKRLLEYQPATYDVTLRPDFPDDFPYHLIPKGRNYSWRTSVQRQYFFELDGFVIWGLTARILKHFLDVTRP